MPVSTRAGVDRTDRMHFRRSPTVKAYAALAYARAASLGTSRTLVAKALTDLSPSTALAPAARASSLDDSGDFARRDRADIR